jgi:MFS family permease
MARDFVETDIPARLDRLPWSAFHSLVVVALGITWILDGLEVTLAGSVGAALRDSAAMHLDSARVGATATAYLLGNITGALGFGWLTDRLGRRHLFMITLGVYLVGATGTALSWDFWSYAAFRCVTGAGIGGEATAINSAIQELIPARYRGRTDIAINGSFWVGAALGAAATLVVLHPGRLPPDLGWRTAFGVGAVLGLVILPLRRYIPESPRWLMVHGRLDEAHRSMEAIEARISIRSALPPVTQRIRLSGIGRTALRAVAKTLLTTYRRRTILGIVLIATQAFFYNAIFFTYALVLARFYHVPSSRVGWYLLPFALGNFLGPLILGHLFDTLGRKPMIAATYGLAGLLLAGAAVLFDRGVLDAETQTIAWTTIFFFASAAASAAYLTISESFPLEIRAVAIALFYALGTLLGGAAAPWIFGRLIGNGDSHAIVGGYLVAALLMIIGAVTELLLGIRAERRPLEHVAAPLSAVAE